MLNEAILENIIEQLLEDIKRLNLEIEKLKSELTREEGSW